MRWIVKRENDRFIIYKRIGRKDEFERAFSLDNEKEANDFSAFLNARNTRSVKAAFSHAVKKGWFKKIF